MPTTCKRVAIQRILSQPRISYKKTTIIFRAAYKTKPQNLIHYFMAQFYICRRQDWFLKYHLLECMCVLSMSLRSTKSVGEI